MGKKVEVWVDIDTATREQMAMVFAQERQRIAEMLKQITYDMDHFNRTHPDERPLSIVLDFNNDVAELTAADDDRRATRKLKIVGHA